MFENWSVIGGAEGDRTPDLRIANAALCQTELLPHARREYSFEFRVSSFEFHVSNFEWNPRHAQPGILRSRLLLQKSLRCLSNRFANLLHVSSAALGKVRFTPASAVDCRASVTHQGAHVAGGTSGAGEDEA